LTSMQPPLWGNRKDARMSWVDARYRPVFSERRGKMHYLWALETPGVLPGFTPIHELGPQTGGQPVPDTPAGG
jgi:hypothetical protein